MKTFDKIPGIEPYLIDMENCMQDKDYHAEGNVLIHTNMVLAEVEKLEINETDKDILRYVAALHDIGKPYCSEEENGHIRSHGHSKKSYHIAKKLIGSKNVELLNLILLHGKPLWVIEKENPEREVIKLSLQCRLELLYNFAKCDVLGRIAEDKNELLEKLEYFKEIALDLDCFDKPYKFNSNLMKYNYIVKKSHHYTDVCFDDTRSKVYMLCGLPGSGKDYYIKNNYSHLPVISLDIIRDELGIKPTDEQGLVIQTAKERVKSYMRVGKDFVWNGTNVTRNLREGLISMFNDYNSYITIVFLNVDIDKVLEQNKNRDRNVPENVIHKLYNKMEIPTELECHELVIV